jgi:hypothetical protein
MMDKTELDALGSSVIWCTPPELFDEATKLRGG